MKTNDGEKERKEWSLRKKDNLKEDEKAESASEREKEWRSEKKRRDRKTKVKKEEKKMEGRTWNRYCDDNTKTNDPFYPGLNNKYSQNICNMYNFKDNH